MIRLTMAAMADKAATAPKRTADMLRTAASSLSDDDSASPAYVMAATTDALPPAIANGLALSPLPSTWSSDTR